VLIIVKQLFAKIVKQWGQQTILIKGRPRHPQSNGCIEQANGTLKHMLQSMMADDNTRGWVKYLPRVQCKYKLLLSDVLIYTHTYECMLIHFIKSI